MTDYRLGAIRVETETMDRNTRRYVKHEPRVTVDLTVGSSPRFRPLPLTRSELLKLAHDATGALRRLEELDAKARPAACTPATPCAECRDGHA